MKRMLFNATQQEELRVAIVDGQKLIDIDIESAGREQRKSNIYKGVITRIEPSLEACFVSYGEDRHGFLPFKEVARTYFREGVDVRTASVKEALREGQEIMVQVEKEERGNKGAALTSFVSLAGRYLVLMPNNPRGGGVSRRVEGEERQELRETMDKLDLPPGMSVIARTAGIGRNVDELQWDLNYLMQLWRAIEGAGKSASGAFLIYQESSLVIRAIRDYFQPDIGEILIDTDDIYEQAHQFMSHVMPDMVHRVKRYSDDVPLFSRFQIEHQIETAYSRTVPLPSGGAIVIDHTEALVSVDVNSARATRGSDIETTAFNTNCEAAEEVARQLRLRDLGGLIVIDFIDMESAKSQREVEQHLKDALKHDRARVQMGKISRFGLMELSRQRLRPALSEGSHVTCPRCNGTGHIRDTESSALQVLRIIQEEAMKENTAAIHCQVPVEVTAFLLNEKRSEINKIESRFKVNVVLIPNKHLETPHYKLERLRHDDTRLDEPRASWKMAEEAAHELESETGYSKRTEEIKPKQEAMVKGITPASPAPSAPVKVVAAPAAAAAPVVAASTGGFIGWLKNLFGVQPEVKPAPAPVAAPAPARPARGERPERSGAGGDRNRNRRGGAASRDSAAATNGATPSAPGTAGGRQPRREEREQKEAREPREARETREPREPRGGREGREPREAREGREPREAREGREPREPREVREPREPRENRGERAPESAEAAERRERGERPERGERRKPQPEAAVEALTQGATVVSELTDNTLTGQESQQNGNADALQADQASAAREGEERRRRRRGRRGGRRDREEEGVTANQAADSAENDGNADSERAQAGVFDTDSSNEADDSRDFAPVVAKPVETVPAVQAPVEAPAHAVTVEPVSAAAISVTQLPEPVRVAQVAPVEAVPVEARRAEAEGFVVSHGAQEVHAAQETSATVAEAPATDIFEKPVSRPIENPFGPTPKVAEEKVESPFADTPKAAEPAPVVAHAVPEAQVAEPVETAPVAETLAAEAVAPVASPAPVVAEASAPVESEPVKTFEPVETVAPAASAPVAAASVAPVAAVTLKEEALKPMLDTAGLVWVNTDADKLRAAREVAAQAEAPKRVVRERKRLPPPDAAPMQQVETGKDA